VLRSSIPRSLLRGRSFREDRPRLNCAIRNILDKKNIGPWSQESIADGSREEDGNYTARILSEIFPAWFFTPNIGGVIPAWFGGMDLDTQGAGCSSQAVRDR
jgi:hypothetical protein